MYTVKIGGKKIKSRLYQEQTGKEAISPMICCTGMHGVHTHTTHIVFYNRKIAELGTRISVQCLDKRNVQQRVKCKKVKSLSPLYCSKIKFINVYSNKATINTDSLKTLSCRRDRCRKCPALGNEDRRGQQLYVCSIYCTLQLRF